MDRAAQKDVPLSWESPPSRLPGLGPTSSAALAAFGIRTVGDLLWTIPAGYDDLRAPLTVDDAVARAPELLDQRVTVIGAVESATIVPMRGRRALRVIVAGEAHKLHAWWFFLAHGVYKAAKAGAPVILIGRLRLDPKKPVRMAHPDFLSGAVPAVRVRYPRYGVPGATLRKAIEKAMGALEGLPDPVPHEIAVREGMPIAGPLLRAVHAPTAEPPSRAVIERVRERIAWAEVFTRTFDRLRAEARAGVENERGAVALAERVPLAALEAAFAFAFTPSQRRAVEEIGGTLTGTRPTRRLLLGDVGTGKTAVALAAVAQAVRSGAQAALLAPTTVLAEQYLDATRPIQDALGVRVALLTGGLPAAERRARLAKVAAGEIDLVVGTHALLSESVKVPKLGLVVVDEQHRLGVAQRLALVQKGARPHLLTLSATPIPRTLALALRGDLPVTTLDERPRGRPPVATELVPKRAAAALTARIADAVARGEQVFVVCPLIEVDADDEGDDEAPLASATLRFEELKAALSPTPVALVHGALGHVKKTEAMRAFRHGEARVLVGTTVVEVGVDVPAATLMIVEGAERFGLAQLHQLRGRVGRGERPGTCVLVHDDELGDLARARLDALVRLDRGEDVARADLELRGAGDLWGTKQSGDEDGLAYLAPGESPPWLARITADAEAVLAADPELEHAEHRALRLAVDRFRTALSVREEAG